MPCMRHARAVHVPCTCRARAVHMPCICRAHAVHMPLQATLHTNVALSQRLEAHLARLRWVAEQAELSAQAEAEAAAEVTLPALPEPAAPPFEAAVSFVGRRPGAVFTLGDMGLGYYRDPVCTQLAAERRGVKRPADEATAQ